MRPLAFAAAVLVAAGLQPAAAADDAFLQLRTLEEQAGEAQSRQAALTRDIGRLGADIASLKADLIAAAAEIRQLERDGMELDAALLDLTRREAESAATLALRREEAAKLLSALVRVARLPPEAVLGLQKSPVELIRSGIVLRSMVPAVEARAAILRADIAELASVRQELAVRRLDVARLERDLADRQANLAALVQKRSAQQVGREEARQRETERLAGLATQAQSLREMIGRLERESALTRELPPLPPPEPPPETVFALVMPETGAAEAASLWPVSGMVKEGFGQGDGQGGISRGVTITAPTNAVVVSPLAGSVRFAGPFLNYKHILILEHPGGYHSLIAGLTRIDAVIGDAILAGEPVGAMGAPEEGGSDLYYELRHNGQPINPQQALATGAVKGSG